MSAKFNFDYILAISRTSVAIADNAKVLSSFPSKPTVAEAVASALSASNIKKRSRLIVLSSEFFRQTVRLHSVQVDDLSPAELNTALCYEIEPFSGLSEQSGMLACEPRESQDGYAFFDVVQISKAEYAEIAKTVESAGCQLLAASGLPEGWTAEYGEADFAQVAKSIKDGASRMPFVTMASRGMALGNPVPLAMTLAVVVAALCALDVFSIKSSLSSLRPDIARRSALAAANQARMSEISSVNAEIARLKKADEARQAADKKAGRFCAAWSEVLNAMASVASDSAVVTSVVDDGNFGCRVNAISASVEGAGLYMKLLTEKLKDSDWSLIPGSFSNSANGGSVLFSFRLTRPEMAAAAALSGGATR